MAMLKKFPRRPGPTATHTYRISERQMDKQVRGVKPLVRLAMPGGRGDVDDYTPLHLNLVLALAPVPRLELVPGEVLVVEHDPGDAKVEQNIVHLFRSHEQLRTPSEDARTPGCQHRRPVLAQRIAVDKAVQEPLRGSTEFEGDHLCHGARCCSAELLELETNIEPNWLRMIHLAKMRE